MSFLNRRSWKGFRARAHENWMGGPSYAVADPVARLRMAAGSCFFGEPMYYHADPGDTRPAGGCRARLSDAERAHLRATLNAVEPLEWRGLTPAQLLERAIDEALAADAEATLREGVRLRQEEHVRTTPQVILVRAANHAAVRGTGLVRRHAPGILQRADEPAVALAYQLHAFGRPIPNALKRALRDALAGFGEYALAKYRMEGRAVKTVDVVNLVHPRRTPAVHALATGGLRATGRTWEAVLSGRGASRQTWEEVIDTIFVEVEPEQGTG